MDQSQKDPSQKQDSSKQQPKEQIVKEPQYQQWQKVEFNNLIFGIINIIFQIIIIVIYGICIRPNYLITSDKQAQNQWVMVYDKTILPWFMTFCYAMLVVPGFGLLVSYLKDMIWSGLGFTFLITAFTLELFFLFNAVSAGIIQIQGAGIQANPTFDTHNYKYFFSLATISGGKYGNTFTFAFKAALANIVGFSAIIGRAGPLEAWIMTLFGTLGFQIQRSILNGYGFDGSGTASIFIYGGFLGIVASLFLWQREKEQAKTSKHQRYTADKVSATFALFGALIVWVFFPVLSMDPTFMKGGQHTKFTGPLSMVFSLCASTLMSFIMSALINQKIEIRDIIYGSISGGVSSATASAFITNPVYAILIGATSGAVQVLGQNFIQKKWIKAGKPVINTTSFILFGVQGIIGVIYSAAWNSIAWVNADNFDYYKEGYNYSFRISLRQSGLQLVNGLICICFGLGIGIICGLIFYFCTFSHQRAEHFLDKTYWLKDDGLKFNQQAQKDEREPKNENENQFLQGNHEIKNQHAYL